MRRMFVTKVRGEYNEVIYLTFTCSTKVTGVFYEEDGWRYFGAVTTATAYDAFKDYILLNRVKDPADIEFDVFAQS